MKTYREIKALGEACWQGYRQDGMKKKGDRMVPNCVPDGAPLGEAAGKPWWKVVKSPAGMPKGHTLIQWGNRYFCFTAEPKSQGQGEENPNWTKAAIWKCDRNGKRTHPTEDPVWDSKQDGWSAEEAMDRWLDSYADPYEALDEETQTQKGKNHMKNFKEIRKLNASVSAIDELNKATYASYIKKAAANIDYEKTDTNPENEEGVEKKVRKRLKGIGRAADSLVRESEKEADGAPLAESTPGKPETMAQRHTRLMGYDGRGGTDYAYLDQKRFLTAVREFAKDWHSGDMALNRMQSLITFELAWLMRGPMATGTAVDPYTDLMSKLAAAFRKRVKSAGLEPTSRLGDAGGWKGSAMGKITPNQIGAYFDLVVDFVQNDWPKIAKSMGNPQRSGAAKAESPAVDIGG